MPPLKKSTTKTRRRPMRGLKEPAKAAVTAVVKRVIASTDEKKLQVYRPDPQTYNSGISTTGEWYNPIPIINQGEGAFQRSGNAIKPTLLDMSWRVSLGTGVSRSCDDIVVLYLFKCKNLRSYADMVARGSAGVFLNRGSQGLAPFTGLLQDIDTPVTTEAFTLIHKKVFRLSKGPGALNGDVGAYTGAGGVTCKEIRYRMKNLPQFMYQQGNVDGLPENYGLCWAIGYAKTDGSAPDVINQDLRVDFTSSLYFTDA